MRVLFSFTTQLILYISLTGDTGMQVTAFAKSFQELQENMRIFSLSLRSLFSDQNVGWGSEYQSFRQLRDTVRKDACWYTKGVLPLSVTAVNNIVDYFNDYVALDQATWENSLADIVTKVTSYESVCHEVKRLHEPLQTSLKKKQDSARVI